jgi:hypothetical protein
MELMSHWGPNAAGQLMKLAGEKADERGARLAFGDAARNLHFHGANTRYELGHMDPSETTAHFGVRFRADRAVPMGPGLGHSLAQRDHITLI